MMEFLWGAATSSHQIEGNNIHNDWWQWEHEGFIEGGARSGLATDHWNRFLEDLDNAASLGLNSYRFSIEWSRIEPKEGVWDNTAIEWYRNLILECEKRKLCPVVTLHHFTSPQWFSHQGGFANERASEWFERYTLKIISEFGNRIPIWCTFNEPMVLLVGTYLGSFMPPGKSLPALFTTACRNMILAHVRAYEAIHAGIKKREGFYKLHKLQVGIAHNMLDFIPERITHPMDWLLVSAIRKFYNQAWLDVLMGKRPGFRLPGVVPEIERIPTIEGKRWLDYIGVNYYTKAYIRWMPKQVVPGSELKIPLAVTFARRKELTSDLDWAIHPNGLKKMLKFVSRYQLPIYVTENGIADRDDSKRPDYLLNHLRVIAECIENGLDIRGYFYWSLLDNFEWVKGFGPRFGLYHVNYETFERIPTRSASVYRSIIFQHRERGLHAPHSEAILIP